MAGGGDAHTVASTLQGDRDAFGTLVSRHQAEIFRLAFRSTRNRHDAEDLTQETFLRAYQALSRYDPAHPFRTWLYGIAVNVCRDAARRRRGRGQDAPEERLDEVADEARGPVETVLRQEQSDRVEKALLKLDPEYRLLIVLYYQEERSQMEIAAYLGMPVTKVKNRLYRARKRLEKSLAPYLETEVVPRALETKSSKE